MQYFTAPYAAGKIEFIDFTGKTKDEQNLFFSKDACRRVRFLKDEIFRIKFIRTYDGRTGIYSAVCHLNMDAVSVFLFFQDLLKVYAALRDGTDLPKPFMPFTEYMTREKQYLGNKEKTDKDEQYFRELYQTGGEPLYLSLRGARQLDDLRKKRRNPSLRSYPILNPLQDRQSPKTSCVL